MYKASIQRAHLINKEKKRQCKDHISSTKPLELVHLDLFCSYKVASLGGKSFGFVIVDNFSKINLNV